MKQSFRELLHREGRVVLMRTIPDWDPTDEEWAEAAAQTRQTIAALQATPFPDLLDSEESIRQLAYLLYLEFEKKQK